MLANVARALLDWLARIPTAFHLWCAEEELRLASTEHLSERQRIAREQQLDVLREYRRRGVFPHNEHEPNQFAPCFVDANDRVCAVACLLYASGETETVALVAQSANYARIREMQFPELEVWANESGFTKVELARIQPAYPATPEQLRNAYDFFLAVWLVGSLAVMSILVNFVGLFFAFASRYGTCLVGFIAGIALALLGLFPQGKPLDLAHTPGLAHETFLYHVVALSVGAVSIFAAALPVFRRRVAAAPDDSQSRTVNLLILLLMAIAFLVPPALVYFGIVGPNREWRFIQVWQTGHYDVVTSVALSGDGALAVTAGQDGQAILWDTETGKRLRSFHRGHKGQITSVTLSKDASRMVTGAEDNIAVLWDVERGTVVRSFQGHRRWINSVALSGDGKYLVTGSDDRTAMLWDVESGKNLQTFPASARVMSVALTEDARRVALGLFDATTCLWDGQTGTSLHTFHDHSDSVSGVALSADGTRLVTGSWGKSAILWDAISGKVIQRYQGHTHRISSVAMTPDAKFLVTGSTDNMATLWNATTGEKLQEFRRHLHPITSVAITRDGQRVLTGSGDNKAIVWNAAKGRKLKTLGTLGYDDRLDW